MPGFELFGDAERKEVNDVLDNGSYGIKTEAGKVLKAWRLEEHEYR